MNEQQTQTNEKHYTEREMGELFHVSRSKLDRLAREGKIKKTKFGSTTLYKATEIQRYLASINQWGHRNRRSFSVRQHRKAPYHHLAMRAKQWLIHILAKYFANMPKKTLQSAVYFGIIPMRLQNQPPSLETRIIYQRRRTRLLRVFLCVAHTHLKNALRVRQW